MNSRLAFHRESLVYFFAMVVSCFLSFWVDIQETVINPDGICYLMSAEAIGRNGLVAAMQLCAQANWPFYSLLIHFLTTINHLSFLLNAYLLNGFLSACTVCFFMLIVKELGGNKRTLLLAAATILLANEMNSVREYIIRDHGYWAFYLLSFYFLLKFFKDATWRNALVWNGCILLATLFRVEGAVFLFLLPHICWFDRQTSLKRRLRCFFKLSFPVILLFLIVGLWFLFHPQKTFAHLGRIPEIIQQLQHSFAQIAYRYQRAKIAMGNSVLSIDSFDDAPTVLLISFLVWYLLQVASCLSWPYAVLVFLALKQNAIRFISREKLVMCGYIFINLIITLTFLAEKLFLSKRYLAGLTLLLMLFVPFALAKLIDYWPFKRQRLLLIFLSLWIVAVSLGGIFEFGYSKAYISQAGGWLAKNLPDNTSLYANDYQLMYYSKKYQENLFQKLHQYVQIATIANGKWKQYDYVALRIDKRGNQELNNVVAEFPFTPIQTFKNKRGDSVVIYKVEE